MKRIKTLVVSLLGSLFCYVEADEAVQYEFALTVEHFQHLSGGAKTGSSTLGSADFTVLADTGAAGWWEGGEVFGYLLANYGDEPADLVANWQGMSNIAAADELKLYELWYQHSFLNGAAKVLVGLHDYNASFYSLDSAGHFTLPPFGIGSEVAQVGPSIFPTTSMAVMVSFDVDQYYGRLAVYDGIPGHPNGKRGTHIRFDDGDGVFRALEMGITQPGEYKIGLGFWQLNAAVENPVTGDINRDNSGLYIIAERYITEQIALFIQAGKADDDVNQAAEYYGLGVTVSDLWLSNDTIGLAVAQARNGNAFLKQNPELNTAETAWELSYVFELNKLFSLQSSAYYIQEPAMQSDLSDALAVGFRLLLSIE